MNTIVSVVVPTFHRDEALRQCLRCLLAQSLDRTTYEILVADDGPCDSTRRLVQSRPPVAGPVVRYIPITQTQGPAGARNAGWRAAGGAVIAFTDDDCLPEPDWLAAGLEAIAGADAATGRTVVPLPDRPTDHQRDTAGLSRAAFITANCFCRRDALEEVGGFDERFTSAWREDSDLHFSLLEKGKKVVRADKAVVVHPVREAPWGISLKTQRRGVFDPLLYRKHRGLYRKHVEPLPRSDYAATAGLILAAAGAAGHRPMWAANGIAVWLMVTAWFAARRLAGTSKRPGHVVEMVATSAVIPVLSVYWRLRGALHYGAFYL